MVSCGDTETGPEVVYDGPRSRLPLQRGPERGDAASNRHADDEDDLEESLAIVPDWQTTEKLTFSQLTCWCQLFRVMGVSEMCGFLGSYWGLRLGSEALAIGDGCLTYSGSMACMPATAWWEGIMRLKDEVLGEEERKVMVGGREVTSRSVNMSSGRLPMC